MWTAAIPALVLQLQAAHHAEPDVGPEQLRVFCDYHDCSLQLDSLNPESATAIFQQGTALPTSLPTVVPAPVQVHRWGQFTAEHIEHHHPRISAEISRDNLQDPGLQNQTANAIISLRLRHNSNLIQFVDYFCKGAQNVTDDEQTKAKHDR